jgi:SSS family solute:Na+ symporter
MVDILMLVLGVTKLAGAVIVIGMIALTSFISTLSGLWGVLVTDVFQFVIKMSMVIALAVFAVRAVGGIDAMKAKLLAIDATRGNQGSCSASCPISIPPGCHDHVLSSTFP